MNTCKHQSINSFMTEILVLSCSANQWTGFCIIRTSVMKDSRLSSCTQTKSLFLHAKSIIFFFCFVLFCFFYLAFLSRLFTIHRTAGERGGYLIFFFLPLPPASQTRRHQLGYCFRELTSLHRQLAAGIERETFGACSLEFTYSTLALVAAVVRKML